MTSPSEPLPNVGRVRNMKSQRFNKTDPALIALISDLKAQERENGAAIWRDIAKRLEKPKRNWAETNLSKLDRYANDGETIIIPGKVLAAGSISKKVTVAAWLITSWCSVCVKIRPGRFLGKGLCLKGLLQWCCPLMHGRGHQVIV